MQPGCIYDKVRFPFTEIADCREASPLNSDVSGRDAIWSNARPVSDDQVKVRLHGDLIQKREGRRPCADSANLLWAPADRVPYSVPAIRLVPYGICTAYP